MLPPRVASAERSLAGWEAEVQLGQAVMNRQAKKKLSAHVDREQTGGVSQTTPDENTSPVACL